MIVKATIGVQVDLFEAAGFRARHEMFILFPPKGTALLYLLFHRDHPLLVGYQEPCHPLVASILSNTFSMLATQSRIEESRR